MKSASVSPVQPPSQDVATSTRSEIVLLRLVQRTANTAHQITITHAIIIHESRIAQLTVFVFPSDTIYFCAVDPHSDSENH
ncbi:unnamed protein product [Jaminaea pallidilutea]